MYAVLAIHHPTSERFTDTMIVLQSILDLVEGSAGLLGGYVGKNAAQSQAIAITLWEEKKQFDAALPKIQSGIAQSRIQDWAVQPPRAIKLTLYEDNV